PKPTITTTTHEEPTAGLDFEEQCLELLLGDGAKVVLEGQRVLPQRTQAANFSFQYPTLKPALENIL
ncbi:MAG: DUF1731 domain-containing protein, partial [Chloroflexaceae bacterium]|nr:DUF1731 domain-containing protein [Chloroflexaceae bacterium]